MKNNHFSFLFTNLKTAEVREVMLELRREGEEYQMFLDGQPAAESAETPNEAIQNGAYIDEPRQWGWTDVKRQLPMRRAA